MQTLESEDTSFESSLPLTHSVSPGRAHPTRASTFLQSPNPSLSGLRVLSSLHVHHVLRTRLSDRLHLLSSDSAGCSCHQTQPIWDSEQPEAWMQTEFWPKQRHPLGMHAVFLLGCWATKNDTYHCIRSSSTTLRSTGPDATISATAKTVPESENIFFTCSNTEHRQCQGLYYTLIF